MSIVNEQYMISNISSQQYKLYYDQKVQEKVQPSSTINENLNSTTNLDPKIAMVEQFSTESGLTLEWAK